MPRMRRFLLVPLIGAMACLLAGEPANGDCLGWESITPPPPGNRSGHALAFDSTRNVTVLFGGTTYDDQNAYKPTDTLAWNGQDWTVLANSGPSPRTGHAMAFDSVRGVTVLFGGYGENGSGTDVCLGDTWEWDGNSWAFHATSGPSPRSGHRLAYDVGR